MGEIGTFVGADLRVCPGRTGRSAPAKCMFTSLNAKWYETQGKVVGNSTSIWQSCERELILDRALYDSLQKPGKDSGSSINQRNHLLIIHTLRADHSDAPENCLGGANGVGHN
jgi:hypothetical protein